MGSLVSILSILVFASSYGSDEEGVTRKLYDRHIQVHHGRIRSLRIEGTCIAGTRPVGL